MTSPPIFVDTVKLIQEVHRNPVLWDVSHPNYKDHRNKKKTNWNSVAENCITNYQDAKTIHGEDKLVHRVATRWKSCKDSYHRSKAEFPDDPNEGRRKQNKPYIFKKYIKFLDRIIVKRKSTGNRPQESQSESDDENETSEIEQNYLPESKKEEYYKETNDVPIPTQNAENPIFVRDGTREDEFGNFVASRLKLMSHQKKEEVEKKIVKILYEL